MAHANQERYSALVDAKLRATLVTRDNAIFNTKYEGNPKAGKVKIPVRDTEVSVKPYNKATGVDLETGTTAYLDLDIDQDEAVNELIDGYDAASVPDGITAERLDSAGYSLALQADTDGSVELTTAPKRSLSTPSARWATPCPWPPAAGQAHFYPRPPRGGRHLYHEMTDRVSLISIHALREEGDLTEGQQIRPEKAYFYPRPPRGGRPGQTSAGKSVLIFLSTPSARRATLRTTAPAHVSRADFYPRPPRGGRRLEV